MTPDTALRLARFFSNSPEFWVNLQTMHDLTRARQECGPMIEREIRPRAALSAGGAGGAEGGEGRPAVQKAIIPVRL